MIVLWYCGRLNADLTFSTIQNEICVTKKIPMSAEMHQEDIACIYLILLGMHSFVSKILNNEFKLKLTAI